ncbi:hypothetical protein BKA67DRAFT_530007 [Truncatella angustata]|uniref:ATPase synthesis protein 25 n=1 Tax=Truncatella angustata TaxID=152316 RepID=A0A9P8UXA7_9PEZI|nr:uncharacterized protein BKA67DRAFT_530007 [Truncatella angustata]KAH6659880.1 hypothetical protein BKA67DRAFT_530007 [Truncatella angustata]
MVSGRALKAAGCSQCRTSLLRLFITPSVTPLIRSPHTTYASWRTAANSRGIARLYSSSSTPPDLDSNRVDLQDSQLDRLEAAPDDQPINDGEPASSQAAVPWYLEVDPPRHIPVAEPPPLPDVPEGSPPIIPTLLKYASEEMGLDDLSLLDLRELDPPPALGQNLFMLFGTARSERHLNVSAGRLVRWLRAKHRIIADADGLLGPNERKTKLKRKAKKARLLGTMGTDDTDDGITTGWICVNMGTINRSNVESAVLAEDGRIAGFGVPQTGSTIVVQVMTESRRTELGLETLWQRTLDRQTKQEPNKELGNVESSEQIDTERDTLSQAPSRPTSNVPSSAFSSSGQSRSFSTSQNHRNDPQRIIYAEESHLSPEAEGPILGSKLYELFGPSEDTRSVNEWCDVSSTHGASALFKNLLHDGPSKVRTIELLKTNINNSSADEAFAILRSASFRKISQMSMQHLPTEQTWSLRLSIESKARQLGMEEHQSLDKTRQLINELRACAIAASREEVLQLLGCIYASPGPKLQEQTRLAMDLLESVHTRGHPIITNDVVVSIIEGMSWSGKPTPKAIELQMRLEDLMAQAKLPYMGEPLLLRLMDAYARLGRWDQFWETWRLPPRFAQPRSEALYLHTFRLAVATKDPRICTETIHRCFQEMIIEHPPIELTGQIRNALLDCVRVADPKAEEHADTIPANAKGFAQSLVGREFVKLVKELKLLRPRRQLS